MSSKQMPAWSEPFQTERRGDLARDAQVFAAVEPPDWLAGRGEGVTVAIIDSGVDGGHPAVCGKLIRSLRVDLTLEEPAVVKEHLVFVPRGIRSSQKFLTDKDRVGARHETECTRLPAQCPAAGTEPNTR